MTFPVTFVAMKFWKVVKLLAMRLINFETFVVPNFAKIWKTDFI